MWNPVEKFLQQSPPQPVSAPSVRKPSMNLASLAPGSVIRFAANCPLPPLTGNRGTVVAVRTYCFGTDVTISYELELAGESYFLTVAEDKQGYYLAVARSLTQEEQDQFFGRDALGFFTESSSAKTIRCKADMIIEGGWVALRYSKTVDWTEGTITQGRLSTAGQRQTRQFHYNLLVDESGEKALEVEHYEDGSDENNIYITVYRPVEDIDSIAEPVPHIPVPAKGGARPAPTPAAEEEKPALNGHAHPELAHESRAPRTDFRRRGEDEASPIHIGRVPAAEKPAPLPAEIPPLPSFLLSRETNYLSLDEILTPETERVRCDLPAARMLIDIALKRRVHVRDILRDLIGLDSMLKDEVIFELPLSKSDYRALAQRYRVKPDHRSEIRERLQEELRHSLMTIAKS